MDELILKQLIDTLNEAYADWREACTQANESYRAGATSVGRRGRTAFKRYVVALDAEEEAAAVYARVVQCANELPWDEEAMVESRGRGSRSSPR